MSAPLAPPAPGTRLGDFLVESVLGAGGGGTVYAARWGHRAVALKVLREDLLPDPSERRRFLDEARLLAEINHPGVVRILGFGELPDGRPYLAMERLEGESLAERVARGPLAHERALALFGQVAQAVEALHQRGLVHRDIKPENIFLVQQERYAVLLDFGIAKPLDAPDSTVTRQGGVRGTPAYMAPERFFGAAASPATDIYELGVVLFAMLTARLPWETADDPVTRLNPRRPSDLGFALPGRLEEELLRALSTRAENRPATVSVFAERVGAALAQPSTPGVRRTADLEATGPQPLLDEGTLGNAGSTGPYGADADPMHLGQASTLVASLTPPPAPTRDLRAGVTGPAGYPTDQATPGLAFGSQTTTSRATGQAQPLPPLPSPARSSRRRSGLTLVLGGIAIVGLVAALVAVLVLRRSGTATPAKAPPSPSNVAEKAPKGPAFDRLLWGLHPKDTYLLIRIHHEELRQSSTWRAFQNGLEDYVGLNPLRLLKKRCGIDLFTQTSWLSVGLSGKPDDPEMDAVLRGTWTRERVEGCIRTLGGSKGDAEVVKRLGRISRVQLGGHFVYVAWPDDRTLMLSTRTVATEGWYAQRLAQRDAVLGQVALRGVYAGLDTRDTLWMVTTEDSFMQVDFLRGLPKPLGISLAVRARQGIVLGGAVTYSDVETAKRAEGALRQNLEALLKKEALLKFLLDRTQVTRRQRVVAVTFELDERASGLLGTAAAEALKERKLSFPKGSSSPE